VCFINPAQTSLILRFTAHLLFQVTYSDSDTGPQKLGYVRVLLAFQVADASYLYVRWYSDRRPGIDTRITAPLSNCDNIFENSSIRNLPCLAWNVGTDSSLFSYSIIPVQDLWQCVWVVADAHQNNLFWHLKHPRLYMHQHETVADNIDA
jgi:hypothetical protein